MATQSGKESRRYFCPDCGVHLWVEVDAWPTILTLKVRAHMLFSHKVGTLDDYSDITLAAEVNTSNAIKSFQPVYECVEGCD